MNRERVKIKQLVLKSYSAVATGRLSCLSSASCCAPETNVVSLLETGRRLGYSEEELKVGLGEANLGLGCGNPHAIAELVAGETVLDLGSGGGIDVFLASKRVGRGGKVIGLDMTPEMVQKARENAKKANLNNVEFRLGEIESIPIDKGSVDVIISNCVICLSPDKAKVFREMFRVLRSGGRLAIADEVAIRPFTREEKKDSAAWCSCVTGAITEKEYSSALRSAGFRDVYVKQLRRPGELTPAVFSAFVSATKA